MMYATAILLLLLHSTQTAENLAAADIIYYWRWPSARADRPCSYAAAEVEGRGHPLALQDDLEVAPVLQPHLRGFFLHTRDVSCGDGGPALALVLAQAKGVEVGQRHDLLGVALDLEVVVVVQVQDTQVKARRELLSELGEAQDVGVCEDQRLQARAEADLAGNPFVEDGVAALHAEDPEVGEVPDRRGQRGHLGAEVEVEAHELREGLHLGREAVEAAAAAQAQGLEARELAHAAGDAVQAAAAVHLEDPELLERKDLQRELLEVRVEAEAEPHELRALSEAVQVEEAHLAAVEAQAELVPAEA